MYCPGWIFDVAVSRCITEFLSSELNLEAFATKYADGLAERYEPISEDVFIGAATELLEFLSEVEAGDQAVTLLTDYSYFRIHVEYNDGSAKPRKLKPMFGSVEDPIKKPEADPTSMIKSFRAYVFGLRSNTVPKAPAGWTVEEENENLPDFVELIGRSASLLDAF
jgi:hypothetical protein